MSENAGPSKSRAGILPLVGGMLALDFCNTASGRDTEGLIEHLVTPSSLLDWCRHAEILDEVAEDHLRTRCGDVGFGRALLRRAVTLRDAIYRLDAALAACSVRRTRATWTSSPANTPPASARVG